MKALIFVLTLVISTTAWTCTAFYTHETVSGMNKICFYDHLGSTVAITVRNTRICPVTIKADH